MRGNLRGASFWNVGLKILGTMWGGGREGGGRVGREGGRGGRGGREGGREGGRKGGREERKGGHRCSSHNNQRPLEHISSLAFTQLRLFEHLPTLGK